MPRHPLVVDRAVPVGCSLVLIQMKNPEFVPVNLRQRPGLSTRTVRNSSHSSNIPIGNKNGLWLHHNENVDLVTRPRTRTAVSCGKLENLFR